MIWAGSALAQRGEGNPEREARRVKIEVFPDDEAVARGAAAIIATDLRAAVTARGRFVMAVSGGRTPWRMLRVLADEPLPWEGVHVLPVDERGAPADDPDRQPLPPDNIHAMAVEEADLAYESERYARTLRDVAGAPAVLDLVHLGLG